MANYREDIVDIELTGGSLNRSFCQHAIGAGDEDANRFGIRTFRNGQPENISGSCFGLFIRPDGQTVTIETGTVIDNVAFVTLPEACYAVEGYFTLAIKVTGGGMTGTMRIVDGMVNKTSTNVIVDPGTIIQSIDALIEAIEEAAASIPADYSELSDNMEQVLQFLKNFVFYSSRDKLSVTGTTRKYWNCETETAVLTNINNDAFRAFEPVDVSPGQIFTCYINIGSTHKARPWLITDDSYTILASSGDQYNAGSKRYTIIVPTGGTKLLLSSASTPDPDLCKMIWEDTINLSKTIKYRGSLSAMEITQLSDCKESGWYGCGASYTSSITDLPDGFDTTNAITLFVIPYSFNSGTTGTPVDGIHTQFLLDTAGNIYMRLIYTSSETVTNWRVISGSGTSSPLYGKTVAIIGDSISTNGNTGTLANVPEITITEDDVGVELNAWLTYYDVQAELSLGGHTFTSGEIGTKVTFTPVAADIGKVIGLPNNYNQNSRKVWWEVAKDELGFTPIPVCWSGSSITSHEKDTSTYKTAHAWHEAQIRKCGIRTPGTMTRTEPDMIIIYRGTNDFSHSPYAKLTDGYFSDYDWEYPEDDAVTNGYGFKEGLCLTIKKLRAAYPNAKIFLCTLNVFKRVNYSHYPTNNGTNSLPQFNDAIREVADFMGCDVINFDRDGITFENCYSEGYITDSSTIPTHPSDKGHKVMGLKAVADILAKYSKMA